MKYEITVSSDVSEANEPLLKDLSSEDYIKQYIPDDLSGEQYELCKKMCIAAREVCEQFTGLAFAEKTLVGLFSADYVTRRDRRIILPFGPHSSISSIYTVNLEGTESELTLNEGYYKYGNKFLEIEFAQIIGTVNAITSALDYKVTYVCGYGINKSTPNLPEPLRVAMAQQVGDWWKNRENWMPVLSSATERILWSYKRSGIL
jgi:uncharacterized phiE125 gp8 family phage protein